MSSVFRKITYACFITSMFSAAPVSAADSSGIGVSVTFSSVQAFPTDCICSAEITDLASKKLIAAPQVVFTKGNVGRMNIGDPYFSLTFEASINKEGTTGTYKLTYNETGKPACTQQGTLSIQ